MEGENIIELKRDEPLEEEKKPDNKGKEVVINRNPDGTFGAGTLANPEGRPKGVRNFAVVFDEAIEEIAKLNNITKEEAEKVLIKKAWLEAKDGKFNYYQDLMNRRYGMPKQTFGFDGDDILTKLNIEIVKPKENGKKD